MAGALPKRLEIVILDISFPQIPFNHEYVVQISSCTISRVS